MSEQLRLEEEAISIVLRRAWDRALRTLSTRVNKPTFETHIRAIRPLSLSEDNSEGILVYQINLGVPSAFTREWVEKRHSALIADVLGEILDRDVRLTFSITPRSERGDSSTGSRGSRTPAGPSLFDTVEAAPEGARSSKTPAATSESRAVPRALQLLMEESEKADQTTDSDIQEIPDEPSWQRTLAEADGRAKPTPKPPVPAPSAPAQASMVRETTTNPSGVFSSRREAPVRSSQVIADDRRPMADAAPLNPRYTFDNFVVGQSNRLAHAGAQQVAAAPGEVYNPLFLYGPPGLGKTHLMHAIGNELARERGIEPHRIAYVSGETFTSHFVTSIKEKRQEEFRRRWRTVDLWLVDDIQFIAGMSGKELTKEEFFHTFNALYQTGKQIVISSDRSPRELRAMDERLRSRFESGLIADIAPPDLETRLMILHRKADIERTRIPDDVLLYMARLVQSNIRTLEGALVKLIAYASLHNSPVTTELASSVLERYYIVPSIEENGIATDGPSGQADPRRGYAARPAAQADYAAGPIIHPSRLVTADLVQRVVARRFGLSPDALSGKRRDRETAQARQIAMHLLRELTEMSLPGIGELFGGRDHSTVSHACDRMKTQMQTDDSLRDLIQELVLQIRAQTSG